MQVTPRDERLFRQTLPIDDDEKILAVYKHHWFAYASGLFVGVVAALAVMGAAVALVAFGATDATLVDHRPQILSFAGVLALVILAGSLVPVYLRSQERIVLTNEAIFQKLQPSLLASKVSQLSLQDVSDVTMGQDFFGTIFGYGHITIETPGEQDNYEFYILPNPQQIVREISEQHESYTAALMSGRLPSEYNRQGTPNVSVDPEQYQQFLAYQQMVAKQQQDQQAQANNPTGNNQPPVA